ncbi:mobilisation protein (plasmid) [Gloeothece citriformis PCC 7424]|uniref:Mobilisation protein n=1 Tax=Gloeothece citriformis (strain PCC 7424) TaxID=65393 RepID=B7KMJ6_GLOC7|nr:MobC family plasmid mobilization relaxosome protein [Gloeothece citriformis]ACK74018.1 mobilisation protein [Gloeothece citriformis PCC 7424]
MTQQRIEKIQLCLTPEEKLKATQLAKNLGTTVSAFFRSAIYKKYEARLDRQIPEITVKSYLKLGKIGNNINQIAKVLNSHQKLNTAVHYDVLFELKQELTELKELLNNLLYFFRQIRDSVKK